MIFGDGKIDVFILLVFLGIRLLEFLFFFLFFIKDFFSLVFFVFNIIFCLLYFVFFCSDFVMMGDELIVFGFIFNFIFVVWLVLLLFNWFLKLIFLLLKLFCVLFVSRLFFFSSVSFFFSVLYIFIKWVLGDEYVEFFLLLCLLDFKFILE